MTVVDPIPVPCSLSKVTFIQVNLYPINILQKSCILIKNTKNIFLTLSFLAFCHNTNKMHLVSLTKSDCYLVLHKTNTVVQGQTMDGTAVKVVIVYLISVFRPFTGGLWWKGKV